MQIHQAQNFWAAWYRYVQYFQEIKLTLSSLVDIALQIYEQKYTGRNH